LKLRCTMNPSYWQREPALPGGAGP
jgi:hypothetical protein